ncbi:MAG: 4-hydroxythreonine-4-phosphate dehydrogenase PdxA [Deltaproteobacteria bacterium]|nr:4-hydroxythreonine-4-phosphate dehydrogenase PdxA [Deltaproteobacteria bacterium]
MNRVAVSMGDPAGIGPEVTVRALLRMDQAVRHEIVVVGEALWLQRVAAAVSGAVPSPLTFVERAGGFEGDLEGRGLRSGEVAVLNPLADALPQLARGRDFAAFGEASFQYVKMGVELVQQGLCRALATAPISKHAWHLAGHDYPGHTELLRELSGSPRVGMMFWGERLKVMLATTHLALARVPAALTVALVEDQVLMLYEFMQKAGLSGKIGLAALNPHAGEHEAFGDEETRILKPALARLCQVGVPVEGPVPADVLFHQALQGRYAVLVALYHDQGLVPFKMLHFDDGVNLSIGLPFIRTSADHGTAFDISDKFIANSRSMESAIGLARRLSSYC